MTSFAAKLKAMNAIINVDNSQLWSSQNFNNWAEEDHNCFTGTMVTGDLVHPPLSIRMVVFYNPPPPPPPSVALCPIRTAHYAKVLRLIIALQSHNLCLLWCFNVYMRTNEKSTAREKNDEREGRGKGLRLFLLAAPIEIYNFPLPPRSFVSTNREPERS